GLIFFDGRSESFDIISGSEGEGFFDAGDASGCAAISPHVGKIIRFVQHPKIPISTALNDRGAGNPFISIADHGERDFVLFDQADFLKAFLRREGEDEAATPWQIKEDQSPVTAARAFSGCLAIQQELEIPDSEIYILDLEITRRAAG